MSAFGLKRTWPSALRMSTFEGKRTWREQCEMSAFDPKTSVRLHASARPVMPWRLRPGSERGLSGVRHLNPLRVGSALGVIVVVPVPPFVRRGLRIARQRVFPGFLAAERRDVEVAPGGAHRFVAPAIDEIGSEHPPVVA